MSEIKNIIFDLGGVILNLDYSKTVNEFKKLGVLNFQELYSQKNSLLFLMILKKAIFNLKNSFHQ